MRQHNITKPVYPNEITQYEIDEIRNRMKESMDDIFGLENYNMVCNTLQVHNGGLGFVVVPDCFKTDTEFMYRMDDKGYAIFRTMSFTFYKRNNKWEIICHTGGDYKKNSRREVEHNRTIYYNNKNLCYSVKGDFIAYLFNKDMCDYLRETKQAVTQSVKSNVRLCRK